MKKHLLLLLIISLVVVFGYREILNVFYQQDEWQTIGNNIVLNNFWEVFPNFNFVNFVSVQERFASNALAYFLMGKFAFNLTLIGIYSLTLHLINAVLVYEIIRRWVVRDNLFALLGSLFFGISDVSISAVSWFGTSLGTLPATTLVLLSLIFYFRYIESRKQKFLLVVLILLYSSFFFKEIGVFLLLFLPLVSLLFLKYTKNSFLRIFWPFFALFILVTSFRIVNLVFLSDRSGELFVTSREETFLPSVIARTLMYPLTSFSLSFLPPEPLVEFSKYFTNTYYPFVASEHFNLIAQTIVIDVFAVLATFIILAAIYIALKTEKNTTKKMVVFWILFFLLSFSPYILLSKSFAYLESRYYYLANLPAGILLAVLTLSLAKFLKRWKLEILPMIAVVLFLGLHGKFLTKDLGQLALVSQERVSFFSELKDLKPTLTENKNVFFLTGDHNYYVPGNIVPFQQGMGYTLMVLYYKTGKIPGELINDRFLWDLNTEGYREVGNLGFGFFSDKGKLHEAVKEHGLPASQINALHYDSSSKKLRKVGFSL